MLEIMFYIVASYFISGLLAIVYYMFVSSEGNKLFFPRKNDRKIILRMLLLGYLSLYIVIVVELVTRSEKRL